jgi:hypothetical protein
VRYAKQPAAGPLAAVDGAAVGVLAFVGPARRPVACPVTPFVDGEDAVITSVLALLGKVEAIRRDPRVALRAAGVDDPPPDGPACLLVHDEFRRYWDLRQLRLGGDISNGQFVIRRRAGSLSPSPRGLRVQISGLRAMSRTAGTNRALLARWRDDPPGAQATADRHT